MAESFGTNLTLVKVTADQSGIEPTYWAAAAKPDQAVTLVLSFIPEGWTAELVDFPSHKQHSALQRMFLKPGEVQRLV